MSEGVTFAPFSIICWNPFDDTAFTLSALPADPSLHRPLATYMCAWAYRVPCGLKCFQNVSSVDSPSRPVALLKLSNASCAVVLYASSGDPLASPFT
jgi:hypothetical protein